MSPATLYRPNLETAQSLQTETVWTNGDIFYFIPKYYLEIKWKLPMENATQMTLKFTVVSYKKQDTNKLTVWLHFCEFLESQNFCL